jgi:hypothetical protein
VLDLNLLLEPQTDYILDIEPGKAPVASSTPPTAAVPLFRRAFTTSRYATAAQLAAAVGAADVVESPAPAGDLAGLVALASATGAISGAALDAALRKAGLRPVVEVQRPEVDLVWTPVGGFEQPRLLVVRTPEPLIRTRREPEAYTPPGQTRLQRKVLRLVPKPFLEVVAAAGEPQMTIVGRPGMNTLLVLLEQARGKTVSLKLRRHDNALLGEGTGFVDMPLLTIVPDAPTWTVAP